MNHTALSQPSVLWQNHCAQLALYNVNKLCMTKTIHGISTFSTDYLFCLLYYITLDMDMQHSDSFYVCFTWYKTSLTRLAQDYGTNTLIYLQISIVLRAPPSFLLALLFLNQQSDHTNADKLWHHCKITKKWTTHKSFLVPSQKHQGTTNFLLATLLEKMRHPI